MAAVAALVTGSLVAHQAGRAADLAAAFGTRRTVVVARHDLAPGDVIGADDVVRQDWPVAMIADGAIDGDVTGRVVAEAIVGGEAVNATRLGPDGVSGIAALVPAGWRAVSVPRPSDGSGLAVTVGDTVDVWSPDVSSGSDDATRAAQGARVVGVEVSAVTLAVRDGDAAGMAAALGRGLPVLALVGPQP